MPLNKQSGNMYSFVTHTWNPIKGKCSHDCEYCYMKSGRMKQFSQKPICLDEKELKVNLGKDNFIFIGSSTDMWAEDVPWPWIWRVLSKCWQYPGNEYLFQTKNPEKFDNLFNGIRATLATTIETNRRYSCMGKAPDTYKRVAAMAYSAERGHKTMITIEPILDFDLYQFVEMIKECRPEWVNVGADSQGHNLPEPTTEKIGLLIDALSEFTEVKIKKTLNRIYKAPNA